MKPTPEPKPEGTETFPSHRCQNCGEKARPGGLSDPIVLCLSCGGPHPRKARPPKTKRRTVPVFVHGYHLAKLHPDDKWDSAVLRPTESSVLAGNYTRTGGRVQNYCFDPTIEKPAYVRA